MAQYLHGCCYWPVKDTWTKAIQKNHFTSWPGLSVPFLNRNLPKSIISAKGHQRQEYSNLQSTNYKERLSKIKLKMQELKQQSSDKNFQNIVHQHLDEDLFPVSDTPNLRSNAIINSIIPLSPTGLGYTDPTGRFPFRSARRNEYIFISYNYDANAILAVAMKDRTATSITEAWQHLHDIYKKAGYEPDMYIQDNEISQQMKDAFTEEQVAFQLVPPGNHRANAAERAIQTFKSHFIAGLAGVDPKFPLGQWD